MCKIIIESEVIKEVLEVVSASLKDTIEISIYPKTEKDKVNKACLITSNGVAQTAKMFVCKSDTEEPVSLILGKEFRDVVSTLKDVDKKITLTVNDTFVLVSAGTSKVPVGIKTEMEKLSVKKPGKESIVMTINSSDFEKAIVNGGYAYTDDNLESPTRNIIALAPTNVEGGSGYGLYVVAIEGAAHMASASICNIDEIAESAESIIKKAIEENKKYLLPANFLMKILRLFQYEQIKIFVTGNQMTIFDGNTQFIMNLKNGTEYPMEKMVATLFGSNIESSFSFKVKAKDLKTAASIAVVNATTEVEKSLVVLELKKEKLQVSSSDGKNISTIKVEESNGDIKFGINIIYLKKYLDRCVEEAIISGSNPVKPLFGLVDEVSNTMLLPVKLTE